MKKKYDIGVVGNWSSMNYGAHLTYYALYQSLIDEGFSVIMLEGSEKNIYEEEKLKPRLFRENPYLQDSLKKNNIAYMNEFNEICDTFVVGSDQLWRYIFFRKSIEVNLLSFVCSHKRKISYGVSFGEKDFKAPDEHITKMRYFLSRFQKISVREKSGVDICREIFGVPAECVLDPVFLCDKQHYENIIQRSNVTINDEFVFVYIVHHTPEKRECVNKIISQLGKKAILVRNLHKDIYDGYHVLFEPDCKIEEWLYYIKNCDRVITDSFHAYCFSIIFNKQIITLFQTVDGVDSAERVFSLNNILGIKEPQTIESMDIDKYCENSNEINYIEVNMRLKTEKERCRKWLLDSLKTEVSYDKIDLLWDAVRPELYKQILLEQSMEEQQREINRLKYGKRNIVLFGAGQVLESRYREICQNINVCAIVDNNSQKWGIKYENIECISPKYLQEIDNPYVLITVKRTEIIKHIKKQLYSMGIKFENFSIILTS